jgi:hypothetical protein
VLSIVIPAELVPTKALVDAHIVNYLSFSGDWNRTIDQQQIRHARESGHPERQNPALSANGFPLSRE